MRICLINANTTAAMTERMVTLARPSAAGDVELFGATARFGAKYVASRAAYAVAGHAALDAYAEYGQDADAVVLACFGDPGLLALKEIAHQPVVGMAEAACLTAAALGGRFGVVTGGERWGPMLRELLGVLGVSDRLAAIETVAPSGAEIAADPDRAMGALADACVRCVTQHGADSVILGGAGLAGLTKIIAPRVPVPLIDSLFASVRMAQMLARSRPGKPRTGSFAQSPAIETTGLGAALAGLMFAKR